MKAGRSAGHGSVPLLLAMLLVCATALGALHASAYTPQAGDSFAYSETITVNNGGGSYAGYTDQSLITGTEQMNGVSGGIVSASYDYSYQYSSNQGSTTAASSSGPYGWSAGNFTYVNGTDNQVGYSAPVYVWFAWTPRSRSEARSMSSTPLHRAVEGLQPSPPDAGPVCRDDPGPGDRRVPARRLVRRIRASYTWLEYFDPSTGYIVGYNYVEQDNGQYQGLAGSFTYTDDLYVTSTSYALTVSALPQIQHDDRRARLSTTDYIVLLAVVVLVIALVAAYAAIRRRGGEHLSRSTRRPRRHPNRPPLRSLRPRGQASGVDLGSLPREQVVIREIPRSTASTAGHSSRSRPRPARTAGRRTSKWGHGGEQELTIGVTRPGPIKLRGMPIDLDVYEGAGTITAGTSAASRCRSSRGSTSLRASDPSPTRAQPAAKELLIDDNRSAVSSLPCIAIDGTDFYFSVKGIGSTTSPFSRQLFRREEVGSLLKNDRIRGRIPLQGEGDEVPKVHHRRALVEGVPLRLAGARVRHHRDEGGGDVRRRHHFAPRVQDCPAGQDRQAAQGPPGRRSPRSTGTGGSSR